MDEKYREILEAFRNPTKMKIITLLVNNNKMTVTGMSKYIKTTRSNLYQVVSNLVSSGIVNEPEIRPKKNYVEKYYSLNEDYFAFHDENIDDEITGLPDSEYREILSSFFMAQSLNLEIIGKSIEAMTQKEIQNMRKHEKYTVFSYGTCSNSVFEKLSIAVKNELKKSVDDSGNEGMFLFLMLPSLFPDTLNRKK